MDGRAIARPPAGALLLILIAYVFAALWLLPIARWQLNPDGVSYILLARRLLSGDFLGAATAHWSPLFSWMLVPLLAAGIDPLLASKLLTDSIGAATIVAAWLIAARFTRHASVRITIVAAFAPIVLVWASSLITPDLLLVCLLLFYLLAILRAAADAPARTTIAAGLLAGLAYLAKAYAMPFFAAHFTLFHALQWISADSLGKRRVIVRRFATGMTAFLAVALPWVVTISLKYGHLTATTAATYNWRLDGPLVDGRHPVFSGMFPPSDGRALSIWDDPSSLRLPPWPAETKSLLHFGRHMIGNAVVLIGIIRGWSLLALPLLLVALALALRRGDAGRRSLLRWTLATAALFSAGYFPLLLEERYVWIVEALLLLMAACIFDELADSGALPRTAFHLLLVLVAISFGVRTLPFLQRIDQSGRVARQQADDLAAGAIDLRGRRLASNDLWSPTIVLNYYLGAHYYGIPKPGEDALKVRRELDRYGIDAFVVWNGAARPAYLDGFRLAVASPHGFVVYERTKFLDRSRQRHDHHPPREIDQHVQDHQATREVQGRASHRLRSAGGLSEAHGGHRQEGDHQQEDWRDVLDGWE